MSVTKNCSQLFFHLYINIVQTFYPLFANFDIFGFLRVIFLGHPVGNENYYTTWVNLVFKIRHLRSHKFYFITCV